MNKVFAEIFSKQPPYMVDGDYFYFNPHYEEASDEERTYYEQIVNKWENTRDLWRELWESRTFQRNPPFDKSHSGTNIRQFWQMREAIEDGLSEINEVFGKIAAENKPVMDISSCNTFGLIPFITKMNPKILCMATDMEAPFMRIMRSRVNSELPEYNIDLASFDNRDMPIKDNSLDYVTSTFGISSVVYDNAQQTFFDLAVDKQKPVNEVYRVLKPGGRYVAIEQYFDWKFNLEKTREAYNRRGRLFGKYAYDEIEKAQSRLKTASMHNQFIAAGFQVEISEKYPKTEASGVELNVRGAFSHLTRIFKIREWADDEKEQYKSLTTLSEDTADFDEEAKDFGVEFAQGEIFYVLRKGVYMI